MAPVVAYPVAIKDDQVMLIRKKRGLVGGWQLPGGAKEYGRPLKQAAQDELYEETGLFAIPRDFTLVYATCEEFHRNVNIVFLCTEFAGEPEVHDTFEIAEARFVPIGMVEQYLSGDHLKFAQKAIAMKQSVR